MYVSIWKKWFKLLYLLAERWNGEISEGGGGEDFKGNHTFLFPRRHQLGSFDRVPQVMHVNQVVFNLWAVFRVLFCVNQPTAPVFSCCCPFSVRPSPLFWLRSMAAEEMDTAGDYWSVFRSCPLQSVLIWKLLFDICFTLWSTARRERSATTWGLLHH